MFRLSALCATLALVAFSFGCSSDDGSKADAGSSVDVTYQDAGDFLPPKPSTPVCNPCNSSLLCGEGGACVAYGDDGSFCGTPCSGDSECTEGYSCKDVKSVEGDSVKQCVKSQGTCECSAWAAAKSLATSCKPAKATGCQGMRYCTQGGLSECAPVADPNAEEVCDGLDNNCDGQVDENTCKDAPECQAGACHPANGCVYSPADGACDDGSKCTKDDKCFDGSCTGAAVSCDDDQACTKDACDPKTGCTHTPLANGSTCDDGQPCTVGDKCNDGKCVAGEDKTKIPSKAGGCDDANPCTEDLCHLKSGACINSNKEGLACDDGDACTEGDVCDKSGNCQKGKAKTCDDSKDCTDDSCDTGKGCVFLPSPTTPCSK